MKTLPLLGAICVLACLLAWELLSPAPDGSEFSAPRPEPIAARTPGEATLYPLTDLAATILARPLFSHDRRPAPSTAVAGPAAIEDMPRLTSIIVGPGGGRAIFDDGSGRPKILAPGDKLGRFRIGTIAPGQVSLIGTGGEQVLRPRFAGAAPPSATRVADRAGSVR